MFGIPGQFVSISNLQGLATHLQFDLYETVLHMRPPQARLPTLPDMYLVVAGCHPCSSHSGPGLPDVSSVSVMAI